MLRRIVLFDQTKAEQSSAGLYRVKLCKTFLWSGRVIKKFARKGIYPWPD